MRADELFYPNPHYEIEALKAKGIEHPHFIMSQSWYEGGHFPHYDPINIGLLRVHNPRSKEYDLQKDFISVKPGRFLTSHFPKLSSTKVAEIANQITIEAIPPRLAFAHTQQEIAHVYETGPSSCMKFAGSKGLFGVNPVITYAGPDLAIAYLIKDDPNGRSPKITARCLAWPAKKFYGRIYGNDIALRLALNRQGYKDIYTGTGKGGSWIGARLTPIPAPPRYLETHYTQMNGRTLHDAQRINGPLKLKDPVFITPYCDHFDYLNLITDAEGTWLQVCTGTSHTHIYRCGNGLTNTPTYIKDKDKEQP